MQHTKTKFFQILHQLIICCTATKNDSFAQQYELCSFTLSARKYCVITEIVAFFKGALSHFPTNTYISLSVFHVCKLSVNTQYFHLLFFFKQFMVYYSYNKKYSSYFICVFLIFRPKNSLQNM